MSRRDILATVELAMAASALSAATYGLVRASYDPYAAVQWVPIAIIGAGTALSFVGVAAVLFVGRAALLLSDDTARAWLQRRKVKGELAALPPCGRIKVSAVIAEHRARADAEEQQHAEAMAAVEAEPMQPQTVAFTAVMPTVTGVTWGFGPHSAGVGEPQQQPWTPPVSEASGRHAGMPAELAAFDWKPVGGGR